jgi:hypothetical protein
MITQYIPQKTTSKTKGGSVLPAIMVHVVQSIVGSNRCHHNAHQNLLNLLKAKKEGPERDPKNKTSVIKKF